MSEPRSSPAFIKRSVWLGFGVGWLTQLGLKTILPVVVLVGVRFFSLETESKSLWLENPSDSSHPVWYALQASVFLGSVLAGCLAAMLSPRKPLMVPTAGRQDGRPRLVVRVHFHQPGPGVLPLGPPHLKRWA